MMEDVVGCKTMETGRTKRGGVPGYLKDKAMRGWSPERRELVGQQIGARGRGVP